MVIRKHQKILVVISLCHPKYSRALLSTIVANELQSQPTLVPLVGANDKLQVNHEYDKINCALTPSQDSTAAGLSRLLKFTIGIFNTEKDGNLDEFKHP